MKKTLLLGTILLGLLTSCDDDDDILTYARINVVHASPDAPGVDLLVDNTKRNSTDLTYPNSTGYLSVLSGNRNLKINAAGTTNTVASATINFMQDKNYSLFAYNTLAQIGLLAVEDNLTPPAGGQAHLRFFHLSPDAPAVTVGTVANGGTFSPVFSDRSFETQASATANRDFTPVPSGTYTFEVRVAGNTVLTIPNILLQAGKIYTVFAKGLVAGVGTQALSAEVIIHN